MSSDSFQAQAEQLVITDTQGKLLLLYKPNNFICNIDRLRINGELWLILSFGRQIWSKSVHFRFEIISSGPFRSNASVGISTFALGFTESSNSIECRRTSGVEFPGPAKLVRQWVCFHGHLQCQSCHSIVRTSIAFIAQFFALNRWLCLSETVLVVHMFGQWATVHGGPSSAVFKSRCCDLFARLISAMSIEKVRVWSSLKYMYQKRWLARLSPRFLVVKIEEKLLCWRWAAAVTIQQHRRLHYTMHTHKLHTDAKQRLGRLRERD